MNRVLKAVLPAVAVVALTVSAVPAQVVMSKKTCVQAVVDARGALNEASVSDKTKKEVEDMIRVSEHLCGEANFVYAETLLAIARGMVAEE